MMPARRAPSACHAKCASSGPCCRSLGHTRNTQGLNPDRSGLDADGEIIATGWAGWEEHAASTTAMATTRDVRRSPRGEDVRGKVKAGLGEAQHSPRVATRFSRSMWTNAICEHAAGG